jgi:HupE / UreJ protein
MQDFAFYFKIGWQHIISWDAADHILFLIALSAVYLLSNWKQVLVLVTAFTIGHSLTLALSVYRIVSINESLVEFLIPCTIIATALFNFFQKNFTPKSLQLNYFLALFFGLIHGLGFANTIRFMLAKGQGQVLLVGVILLLSFILVNQFKLKRKYWVWALSGVSFCIALKMVIERWIF